MMFAGHSGPSWEPLIRLFSKLGITILIVINCDQRLNQNESIGMQGLTWKH